MGKRIYFYILLLIITLTPIIVFGDNNYERIVISSSINEDSKTYSNTVSDENTILVTGGESKLKSCIISKNSDSNFQDDSFGVNSAVLVTESSSLSLLGGSITTSGNRSEGLYLKNNSKAILEDTVITTSQADSHGVVLYDNSSLEGDTLNVTTSGNSSYPIYLNSTFGNLKIEGGEFVSNGVGSPVIYTKGSLSFNNAKLTSNSSSGIVLDGNASLDFNKIDLTSNHSKSLPKEKDDYFKNIFIYNSSSNRSLDESSSLSLKNSTITTKSGSTFCISNNKTKITLNDNIIVNSEDKSFMKIFASRWGIEGNNGGDVTLSFVHQSVHGNIDIDSLSTLDFSMSDGSLFEGVINHSNEGKNVVLSLSRDSVFLLTGDVYLNELKDEVKNYSNIYSNGHHLYVNGKEIKANKGTYEPVKDNNYQKTTSNMSNINLFYPLIILLLLVSISYYLYKRKRKI